jgi:cytoskeletal protein CcmA (bactofilin family)
MARDEINAFLGSGTTYQGTLNFQGSVRIDGNFIGEVLSEGTLVVGQEAEVQGDITVGQLVLSGKLKGDVKARERVIFHKTANFVGSLETPSLAVEEGAVMEGKVTMGGESSEPSLTDAESGEVLTTESVASLPE